MKRNKGLQLSAVLAVMLIVSMAFLPMVSAQVSTDDLKTKEISKEDNEKLEQKIIDLENKTKEESEKSRKKIPIKDAISLSLPDSTDFTIQTTETFNSANTGDAYSSDSGTAWANADSSLSNRRARETVLGSSGFGWGNAWSYVGTIMTFTGSSKTVNIAMKGYAQAYSSSLAGGASRTKIFMGVYDATTGTEYATKTIFDESTMGIGDKQIDREFNVGNAYYLENGHTYLVYLQVQGSESTVGSGYACTDAGPWDGDMDGYVTYDYFTISW